MEARQRPEASNGQELAGGKALRCRALKRAEREYRKAGRDYVAARDKVATTYSRQQAKDLEGERRRLESKKRVTWDPDRRREIQEQIDDVTRRIQRAQDADLVRVLQEKQELDPETALTRADFVEDVPAELLTDPEVRKLYEALQRLLTQQHELKVKVLSGEASPSDQRKRSEVMVLVEEARAALAAATPRAKARYNKERRRQDKRRLDDLKRERSQLKYKLSTTWNPDKREEMEEQLRRLNLSIQGTQNLVELARGALVQSRGLLKVGSPTTERPPGSATTSQIAAELRGDPEVSKLLEAIDALQEAWLEARERARLGPSAPTRSRGRAEAAGIEQQISALISRLDPALTSASERNFQRTERNLQRGIEALERQQADLEFKKSITWNRATRAEIDAKLHAVNERANDVKDRLARLQAPSLGDVGQIFHGQSPQPYPYVVEVDGLRLLAMPPDGRGDSDRAIAAAKEAARLISDLGLPHAKDVLLTPEEVYVLLLRAAAERLDRPGRVPGSVNEEVLDALLELQSVHGFGREQSAYAVGPIQPGPRVLFPKKRRWTRKCRSTTARERGLGGAQPEAASPASGTGGSHSRRRIGRASARGAPSPLPRPTAEVTQLQRSGRPEAASTRSVQTLRT